jgi:hypothetical protein
MGRGCKVSFATGKIGNAPLVSGLVGQFIQAQVSRGSVFFGLWTTKWF